MAGFQIESGTCIGRGFSGVDANGFLAKLYTWITKGYGSGGPAWYIHDDQSALGTNPYIVVTDTSSPSVNDYNTAPNGGAPKFLKIGYVTSEAGFIRIQAYLWWNNSTQTGYGLWAGYRLSTVDAGEFTYDFRGGGEQMIVQSRIGTSYDTFVMDDFVGDTNLLEASSVIGTLQSGVTAGNSVTLQLDTGEASNFTADKYYYLCCMNGHSWVDYVKCTAVNAGSDQITVDAVDQNFPSGAIIGAYPHRYYCASDGWQDTNDLCEELSRLPYCSYHGSSSYAFHDQSGSIVGCFKADYNSTALSAMNPDDEGRYGVQRPGIVEYTQNNYESTAGQNRRYGVMKNVYMTAKSTMVSGQDGITINSKNYLYFRRFSNLVYAASNYSLFLDTESTS